MRSYLTTLDRITNDLQSVLRTLKEKQTEILELKDELSKCVEMAEKHAKSYEAQALGHKQVRSLPEGQLCTVKAQHWRIVAKWLREIGTSKDNTINAKNAPFDPRVPQ